MGSFRNRIDCHRCHACVCLALVIASLLAACTQPAQPTPSPTATLPTATPIALGIFHPDLPTDPATLTAIQQQLGRSPAIVLWFQDWAHGNDSRFPQAAMTTIANAGIMPLLTWEPWNWSAGVRQPEYRLRTIINGQHDAYIQQWARDAAAWGQPFYLRFAHEMNSDWYPWSAGVNGNSASDFKAAWQHVAAIFRQEQATNVRWVWCVNVQGNETTPLADLYPGDAWVDWVSIDGYNWGTSQSWSTWESFATIFAPTYNRLTALTTKPLLISETASADQGGDKASWITQAFLTDIPQQFPRLRAIVWFSERKEANWPFDSSATTLAAFRTVAGNPQYQGKLP